MKKLIIIIIILIILTIGAVSAADENTTADDLTISEAVEIHSVIGPEDESLSENPQGTFTELSNLIKNTKYNETLELDKDYANTGSEKEITITTSMTIDGKGHTINANKVSRIFKIDDNNVILKNIIFTNGNSDYGGAVDDGSTFNNCSFINCSAKYAGGAINFNGGEINNCTFINCQAQESGAISFPRHGMFSDGAGHGGIHNGIPDNSIVKNSNFINCSSNNGGAFCFDGGIIGNCNFINCSASNGGAIYIYPFKEDYDGNYWYYYYAGSGIIRECNFINCIADYGGAIHIGNPDEWFIKSYGMNDDANSTVINCNFMNCYAADGGSIYWNNSDGKIENSNFTSSHAKNGGAVYANKNINLAILNSNFKNNTAEEFGSAVYGGVISNCNFSENRNPEINDLYCLEADVNQNSTITYCPVTLHPPKDTVGNFSLYVLDGDNYTFIDCVNIIGDTIIYYNATKLGDNKIKAIFDTNYGKFESYALTNVTCIEFDEHTYGYWEDLDYTFYLNDPYHVSVNLPKDAQGNLSLYVSNELYECINITNGTAEINFKTMKAGKYLIEAVCDCNYGFEKASKEAKFRDGTSLFLAVDYDRYGYGDEIFYRDNEKYIVEVRGSDGKLVPKNTAVKIKIDSTTIKAKTNAEGIASVSLSKLKPGKHTVTATYKNFKKSNTLTVKHILKLKTVKVKKSAKKLVLTATLKNKKAITGKTVTFKFNGKTYKAKTNSKGIAKVTVPKSVLKKLKVGKKITYKATYLKDTVKKTAKVKK